MIELADVFNHLLQLLIIVEPAANLGNPLATHAELLRASAGICHGQNEHLVPFATRAFRATFAVPNSALQQRAAQQFAGYRQLADKPLTCSKGSVSNHSQE